MLDEERYESEQGLRRFMLLLSHASFRFEFGTWVLFLVAAPSLHERIYGNLKTKVRSTCTRIHLGLVEIHPYGSPIFT